jgi:hypothetical protein
MPPHSRKPLTRRTKPTWNRTSIPEIEGDGGLQAEGRPSDQQDDGDRSGAAPASTARLTLSKATRLREDAAARVGVAPKRVPDISAEARATTRVARTGAPRTGPSLLDQASSNIGYIRKDLTRIAMLAAIMVGVIVALSFVLA